MRYTNRHFTYLLTYFTYCYKAHQVARSKTAAEVARPQTTTQLRDVPEYPAFAGTKLYCLVREATDRGEVPETCSGAARPGVRERGYNPWRF